MNISKLEVVPLRTAFPHEAQHFTIWLEENIEALAERLNLDLTVQEREKSVGTFNVDLFCEDESGNYVVVENQIEKSDHDHLGKLLTYLVNLEAKTGIWVTSSVRPEHQRTIDWLNETTGAEYSFYLVQVEAIRIADSPFAPLFTVLAAPDEQTRIIGESKKEWAERHFLRRDFWAQLLERSKGRTNLFSNVSPGTDSWIATGSGKSGITFNYVILKDRARVELYIDTGDQEKNKHISDYLYTNKHDIENDFQDTLKWSRLDEKRASRISKTLTDKGSLNEPDKWTDLQDAMISTMIKLDKALRSGIQRINI